MTGCPSHCAGHDEPRGHAATRFPFRPIAEWLPASRSCVVGAVECRDGAAVGGRLLLRIDDIDATRCRPEYEAAIYEDLAWLGLSWAQPVWRESEHPGDYRAALAKLEALGLVYPSFESRAEIAMMVAGRGARGHWPRDPDGAPLYPGNAKALELSERRRRIEAGEPYALRLDMAAAIKILSPFTSPLEGRACPRAPTEGRSSPRKRRRTGGGSATESE